MTIGIKFGINEKQVLNGQINPETFLLFRLMYTLHSPLEVTYMLHIWN